jgi:hypothetical protein
VSTQLQGYQLRTLAFGQQVIKGPSNTPQTTTATLATVAGGSVLVTSMLGLVTTVIASGANTLALGVTPTTGTQENAGIAAAVSIASLEVGTWLTPLVSAGAAGTLVSGGHAGNAVFLPTPFVVPAGSITWTTTGSTTGQIKWYFTYVPLDTGASLS